MLNVPRWSGRGSPSSSEQNTGSPSKRGKQHHATRASPSISAPMLPLPISARSSEVIRAKLVDNAGKARKCHIMLQSITARDRGREMMSKLCEYLVSAASLLGALSAGAPPTSAQTHRVQPVLAFPEAGLDDPAAYQGYQTRFFRDTKGNVVQIYLDARSGRVVNLLPDAVNESVGFTVRDGAGKPIRLERGSPDAIISQAGNRRTIEYQLVANSPQILIGWILLGSMRVERDLGYSGRQLELFDWPTFRLGEQEELIANLDRLDPAERERQLGFFNAGLTSDLKARLEPDLITTGVRDRRGVTASQTTLDGKTNLQLDLSPDPRDAL